ARVHRQTALRSDARLVRVQPDALQREASRLESNVAALVGLVAAQPADVLEAARDEAAFLGALDSDSLAGGRRGEGDRDGRSCDDELVRPGREDEAARRRG